MKKKATSSSRRNFIMTSAALTVGAGIAPFSSLASSGRSLDKNGVYVIGPLEGYTPQIGTLVSMLNYNRQTIIDTVKNMSVADLDYLHDEKANTIGAMVLHLGATEKYYQINTFEGRQEFNDEEKSVWGAAMNLGDEGRNQIKGHDAKYYLDIIGEVRQKTLAEFKNKDDAWLLTIDPEWSKEEPLNTYWKWFHVCEHESNHRGQMTWLKSRLPGTKPGKE